VITRIAILAAFAATLTLVHADAARANLAAFEPAGPAMPGVAPSSGPVRTATLIELLTVIAVKDDKGSKGAKTEFPKTTFPTTKFPKTNRSHGVAVGDLNGDGRPDFAKGGDGSRNRDKARH
jgi:hypothetical protein